MAKHEEYKTNQLQLTSGLQCHHNCPSGFDESEEECGTARKLLELPGGVFAALGCIAAAITACLIFCIFGLLRKRKKTVLQKSIINGGEREDINTLHGTYQYLKSTGQHNRVKRGRIQRSEDYDNENKRKPKRRTHLPLGVRIKWDNENTHKPQVQQHGLTAGIVAPKNVHQHRNQHEHEHKHKNKNKHDKKSHYSDLDYYNGIGNDYDDDVDDDDDYEDEYAEYLDAAADALNNTKKAQVELVIFNRVPKVGSQSMMQLMIQLGKVNNFEHSRDAGKPHETIMIKPPLQKQLLQEIYNKSRPHIYSQHLAYINVTRFHMPRPIYINLVRDPVERIISWHYYVRAEWYYRDMKAKLGAKAPARPSDEFMNMDFDTCVRTQNIYCQFNQMEIKNPARDHRRQTLFFCGQNQQLCMPFNSQAAMQKAKRTVEEEYAVVGTWEDTNITLSVLEHYIPRFFKNAKAVYHCKKLNVIPKSRLKQQTTFLGRRGLWIYTLNPKLLNNTQFATHDFLVFNRVPKVGSEQLIELIRRLSEVNGFGVSRAPFSEPVLYHLDDAQQGELAEKIHNMGSPYAYSMHFNYINFRLYDLPQPIYINMVRDPVERVISWFYYRRTPWNAVQTFRITKHFRTSQFYKKNYEQCVLEKDPECVYMEGANFEQMQAQHVRQSLYFCGHEPVCEPFNSYGALQQAKENVEHDFAVVGSWEDVNVTLKVLEYYVPKYFRGVTKLYYDDLHGLAKEKRNGNAWKPPVSDRIKNMVRQNFSREYEFYHFCKQRLYKQYFALQNLE
ncbi:heparan sulfate 2-O-sulfotransferase pipe-like [Lucilia cuprina]|uniref:heparan sulfate 2-O-sulfotransferase pipe-like n=1 Tax=Lucilia cuprina TaxID=7375 RepID=UPI001F06E4CC|nr:heparan sulfate 2-O-sulfotransferase pipe-like [Lucilia cuprina]